MTTPDDVKLFRVKDIVQLYGYSAASLTDKVARAIRLYPELEKHITKIGDSHNSPWMVDSDGRTLLEHYLANDMRASHTKRKTQRGRKSRGSLQTIPGTVTIEGEATEVFDVKVTEPEAATAKQSAPTTDPKDVARLILVLQESAHELRKLGIDPVMLVQE